MKRILFALTAVTLIVFSSCKSSKMGNAPIQIIFDTDIGNDIDDTEALDLLLKKVEDGQINLLGICTNKCGVATAKFVDAYETWSGHTDIPIGIIHLDGCPDDAADGAYTGRTCALKDQNGATLLPTTIADHKSLPESHKLYRKLLSQAEDHSVVIVTVGFFTNLCRLMDSPADEYSPLTGLELIAKKVKFVSIMAGRFDEEIPEYNIVTDIPASKKVLSELPVDYYMLTWELGMAVRYPFESIENDFNWCPAHPLKSAYMFWCGGNRTNNAMFDPTAVVYAVGDTTFFHTTGAGDVTVDDKGVTRFSARDGGHGHVVSIDNEHTSPLVDYFRSYLTRRPAILQE